MVTITELPASCNLFCSSNFTDFYNNYNNNNEKVDMLEELPKWDTDAKWVNAVGKMEQTGLLHNTGLPQTFSL